MMLKHLSSKPYKSLCYGLGVSASVFVLSACGGGSSSGGSVPAGPVISVSEASEVEGALGETPMLNFTLTLAEASDQATSVDYTTQDGTATSGEDYTAIAGTLNFTAGETSATVTVDIVGDDTFEVDEYFALVLSNAQGLELNESSIGKGTIETDENADSKGYFFGSGTMGSTPVSDLIGLAYDKRLMLFSKTGNPNVLYDIKRMVVDGTTYTATADVYEDGEIAFSGISVKGETTEASISGTVTQLDSVTQLVSVKGSFEVAFIDESNQRAATWERIKTKSRPNWRGMAFGINFDNAELASPSKEGGYAGIEIDPRGCVFVGDIIDNVENIYFLSHDMIAQTGFECDYISENHTGFASVVKTTDEDDTLVFAYSNGDFAQFSIMMIP